MVVHETPTVVPIQYPLLLGGGLLFQAVIYAVWYDLVTYGDFFPKIRDAVYLYREQCGVGRPSSDAMDLVTLSDNG
jgi:hypothetical protein